MSLLTELIARRIDQRNQSRLISSPPVDEDVPSLVYSLKLTKEQMAFIKAKPCLHRAIFVRGLIEDAMQKERDQVSPVP